MREVYMDNAATTKLSEEVYNVMVECLANNYANASSLHKLGRNCRKIIEDSRKNIAQALSVKKEEIIFTSGATEADNMALIGVCRAFDIKEKNHIITTKVEHKAILNTCKYLESIGYEVTYLDVDSEGLVSIDSVKKAIKDTTLLISIMAVNNEIGTIMPIKEIGKLAKQKNIVFHTDAVAGFGKINLDMQYIDLMSVSGHKIYGPKGIGLLYVRKGIPFENIIYGGPQEFGMRPGTESIASIKAMEMCVITALNKLQSNDEKELFDKREYLYKKLIDSVENIILNGHKIQRIAGNLNISIKEINGVVLADQLSREGIYVSTSSACNSKEILPSYVLKVIGCSDEEALSAIRITFDNNINYKDLDYVVDKIVRIVEELREI